MPITDRSSPASSSYSEASDAGSPLLDALHQSERTRDVLKTVMKSRKSWKSLKDGEVVWPPELEVALLEGS
jgi:transcriptional enhancer factor